MLKYHRFIIAILKWSINILKISALITNIVNIDGYNPGKQKLFGNLNTSKSCQGGPGTQNLEALH